MEVMQFKVLIRIQMEAILRKLTAGSPAKTKKTKKAGGRVIGFAILFAFLGLSILMTSGALCWLFASEFVSAGLGWLYMTILYLSIAMLMMIGTVFLAKSQLFEAKDNAILLPMPIKPSLILLSRMVSLYVMNLVWGVLVWLPGVVCWYLFAPFSVLTLSISVILFLCLGLFALAIACLLGWGIARISAHIRNKTFVTVALSLIFIGIYYYAVGIGMNNLIRKFIEQSEMVAATLGAVAPLYRIGDAAANGTLLSLLGTLVLFLLPFALVWLLLVKTFYRTVTESHSIAKRKYEKGTVRALSVSMALLKRENARLLSSAIYLLNAGLGPIFLIIGAVAVVVKWDTFGMTLFLLGEELIPAIFAGVPCMLIAMSLFSAPSVSLEAKTLWILRAMPVDSKEILAAKWKLHAIWCALPTAVFSIVGVLFFLTYEFDVNAVAEANGIPAEQLSVLLPAQGAVTAFDTVVGCVAIVLLPQLFVIMTGGVGLLLGIRFVNLNWVNEAQVVKQGAAVGITMLVNMVTVALLALAIYFGRALLPVSVWLLVWTVLFAAAIAVIQRVIDTWGVKTFESLAV